MPGAVAAAMGQKLPALRSGRFWPMPPRRPLTGGGSVGYFDKLSAPAAGSYALGEMTILREPNFKIGIINYQYLFLQSK